MQYEPGVCNIGSPEKKMRVRVGIIFAIVSVAFAAFFFRSAYLSFVFIPLFISALGFVQARQNFCVAYGLQGKESMGAYGKAILARGARGKDVVKSVLLIASAALIALGVTMLLRAF